jgi:hypothetical protein
VVIEPINGPAPVLHDGQHIFGNKTQGVKTAVSLDQKAALLFDSHIYLFTS